MNAYESPFHYEPDIYDDNAPITVRDRNDKYLCAVKDEEAAQLIVEALSHHIIEEE